MLPNFLRPKRGFLARLSTARALEGALSAKDLEKEFQKERARSDRSNQVFSMVVFRVARGRLDQLAPLVSYARERMRIYDSVGVLDGTRVSFILPETSPEGAWVFAEDCLDQLEEIRKAEEGSKPADQSKVTCEVFGYPLDWEKRNTEDDGADGGGSPPVGQISQGQDGGKAVGMHAMKADPKASRARKGEEALPVGDLSYAFLEPLPWSKRIVDIIVSLGALILISPILILSLIHI